MQILNVKNFRGIFPHKGKQCAKMENSRGILWIPVKKNEYVLANSVAVSSCNIPVESVEEARQTWRGQTGALYARVSPEGLLLTRDVKYETCWGADARRGVFPSGARIWAIDPGNTFYPDTYWVQYP